MVVASWVKVTPNIPKQLCFGMYSHNARSVKLHTTESVPCMICLCAKFCLRQTNGLLADMFAQTDTLGLSRGVLVCIKHMNYSFILLFRAIHFGDSWEGF